MQISASFCMKGRGGRRVAAVVETVSFAPALCATFAVSGWPVRKPAGLRNIFADLKPEDFDPVRIAASRDNDFSAALPP
jgi:hypothetical protein